MVRSLCHPLVIDRGIQSIPVLIIIVQSPKTFLLLMICWQWSCHRICFEWRSSWSKYHRIDEAARDRQKDPPSYGVLLSQMDGNNYSSKTRCCWTVDDDSPPLNITFPTHSIASIQLISRCSRSLSSSSIVFNQLIIICLLLPSKSKNITAVRFNINDFVSIVISLIRYYIPGSTCQQPKWSGGWKYFEMCSTHVDICNAHLSGSYKTNRELLPPADYDKDRFASPSQSLTNKWIPARTIIMGLEWRNGRQSAPIWISWSRVGWTNK